MFKKREWIYIAVIAVLILTIGYTIYSINNISNILTDRDAEIAQLVVEKEELTITYNELNHRFELLSSDFSAMSSDLAALNATHASLEAEYSSLSEQKEELNKQYDDLSQTYTSDFSSLMDEMNDFEEKIQTSIDWFRDNRDIKDFKEYRDVKLDLYSQCIEYDEDSCDIKLLCLPFINSYRHDVKYKYDVLSVNKTDFLLDLDQIWKNKGGDCEDISLLFTAEYNYLVERCSMLGYDRDQIRLFSFQEHEGSNTYATYEEKYYYSDTEPTEVTIGDNYIYPVCGHFPGAAQGHCVVAITENEITSSGDIYTSLTDAVLVEPQLGNYLGKIGDPWNLLIYDSDDEIKSLNYVSVVMTEDDIKYFYTFTGENKWTGYRDFLNVVEEQKSDLRELWLE